ncbi:MULTISPECIES: MFS transporter [unclassified Bifidobacterium]|uniref:MFS transporter n=1 Tax=unclassified Bifidobacterium TaxID=2608897 RepID=UPI0011264746|nr:MULTISPECIES: MFS transporter [unclassified Bifidobacterium]TPF78314.1 arabinose transporter [Bifidobacterium sp. UTCIF-1]TPF81265.1 arabinose transporter [Bifidobacterium sp. UTCIF-24]TPF82046.1 arabinose transporter [Bifidobacterium sp. UTCIF-3]TPF85106.1 arabinose transporter [Bifidobacterium sp. UTCIF-36]TPF91391.1 arabinose transporter [Bifidobacterium sp. UTBIF-56]
MANAPASTARTDRFFTLPVVILIFASFMLGMSEFVVVGILPDIATGLKVSEVTVGNLVAIFAFMYAPCTPLGSAISGRFPRFATYLTLMGVFLAGNVLCAFAPNYPVLLAARLLIASVSGTLVAIAMTFAPDVTQEHYRTKFIAWVFSGFSIASVVGVPIGTYIANTFGWRVTFYLISALTVALMVLMFTVLPRNSHIVKVGFLSQFRLFFDRRIHLGVLIVVCGAGSSYVFYTYLTPILRDEVHLPGRYVSLGLVVYGVACLWSNLYAGKLAEHGRGVEPLFHLRWVFLAHAALLCSLAVAHWLSWYGAIALILLGMFMYLFNASSQVLYMDVAAQSHPGSMNLAASLNSMSFNIGIAIGSAVGGVVNDHLGLTWLGPVGAMFALLAMVMSMMLGTYIGKRVER